MPKYIDFTVKELAIIITALHYLRDAIAQGARQAGRDTLTTQEIDETIRKCDVLKRTRH